MINIYGKGGHAKVVSSVLGGSQTMKILIYNKVLGL